MKAIVSVISPDKTGIIARVSGILYENNVNILDISQSVMREIFSMVMVVDIADCAVPFSELIDKLDALGKEMNMSVRVMHQDIFNSMHQI